MHQLGTQGLVHEENCSRGAAILFRCFRQVSCVTFALLALSLACTLGACSKKAEEPNPIPTPAKGVAEVATVAPEPLANPGDQYIEALKSEERTAAAGVAEEYIREKTKNHLDKLELNPASEYWTFPEDLNEFNKVGLIITFDAYVDKNTEKPYRIVLVRGSENSKSWEVKRFRADNRTAENGSVQADSTAKSSPKPKNNDGVSEKSISSKKATSSKESASKKKQPQSSNSNKKSSQNSKSRNSGSSQR